MHRELGVNVRQRVGDRGHDSGRLWPGGTSLLEPLGQADPRNEVPDEVNLIVLDADIMNGHNARVTEPRDPTRLLKEALRLAPAKHLDGDLGPQLRVVTQVDRAEAAVAEHAKDGVAAERCGQGCWR